MGSLCSFGNSRGVGFRSNDASGSGWWVCKCTARPPPLNSTDPLIQSLGGAHTSDVRTVRSRSWSASRLQLANARETVLWVPSFSRDFLELAYLERQRDLGTNVVRSLIKSSLVLSSAARSMRSLTSSGCNFSY